MKLGCRVLGQLEPDFVTGYKEEVSDYNQCRQ